MARKGFVPFSLALLATVLTASACGGGSSSATSSSTSTPGSSSNAASSSSPTSGSGSQTLSIAVWSNFDFVKTAADAFMKSHPGVNIRIDAIPGDDYFTSLPRTLGSGQGDDITVLQVAKTGSYPALLQEHALVDVSDVWKRDGLASATPATVKTNYTTDGKQYAVNIDETYLPVVYYNKDLFAKLHISAPNGGRVSSLVEFKTITDALAKADKTPLVYAWTTDGHHLFQQNLLSSCGSATYLALAASSNKGAKQTASWTDPCVVRAIQTYATMGKEGVFGKSPVVDGDTATAAFESQKAGMFLSGSWEVGELKKNAKFGWGWFLMPPAGPHPTQWILYPADGLGINAQSKHIPLAKDFLASMMTRSFQSSLLSSGRPPSRTDVTTPKDAIPQLVEMQKSLSTLGSQTHLIQLLAPADLQPLVVSDSQQVLQGSLSPEAMAQQLQALAEKLRAGS